MTTTDPLASTGSARAPAQACPGIPLPPLAAAGNDAGHRPPITIRAPGGELPAQEVSVPNDPLPALMTMRAAAAALGRAERTLRHWAAQGRLTIYRDPVSRRRFFAVEEVRRLAPQPVLRRRDPGAPHAPVTPTSEPAS